MPLKRFLIVMMIVFTFVNTIFSQTASEKKKELDKVKKENTASKKKASESEKKKKQAIASKKKVESELKKTQKKVSQLKNTESHLKKNLNLKKNLLNSTREELTQTASAGNNSLKLLLLDENRDKYLQCFEMYKYPLAVLVNNSSNKYNSLSLQKKTLENETNKTELAVKNIHFQGLVENKKAKNYLFQTSKLEKDIQKYEQERKSYLQKAQKLQKNAQALQALIKKLTPKPTEQKHYSYKFPGGQLSWPVKGKIIRQYGVQTHEKYNISTMNNGVDIAVNFGSSVKASADGEVVYADTFSGSGQMIIIDHKNGYHSVYGNNSQLNVSRGAHVKKGQAIAYSGNSSSTGEASVHFELRKNGKPVNPLGYLN